MKWFSREMSRLYQEMSKDKIKCVKAHKVQQPTNKVRYVLNGKCLHTYQIVEYKLRLLLCIRRAHE